MFDERLHSLSFVAFDLEATGAAPGYDRIIEVAAARFAVDRDGRIVPGPLWSSLVRPGRLIPDATVALTGIDDDAVAQAPSVAEAWPELRAFIDDSDRPTVLLAHKASTDLGFLVSAGRRLGHAWSGPPFACTLAMARGAFPEAPSYKLGRLVSWLGAAPEDAVFHRAGPDALHTRNLFARAVARRGARTLADLGVRRWEPVPAPRDFEVAVPERLAPIERAIAAQEPIRIVYRAGSKGASPRPVTPVAFYAAEGRLWLRAFCHVDEVTKSFRCDRIKGIRRE